MSRELMWLTLTVILTGLLWIPYILDRIVVRGLMGAMANPSRHDKPQSPWAQRLYFAHTNAVENLVIFATLVLILDTQGHSTESTVIACAVYFWARLAHAVIYALGIPVLRTLAFAVGFWRRLHWCWRYSGSFSLAVRRAPRAHAGRARVAACRRRRHPRRRAATRRMHPLPPAANA